MSVVADYDSSGMNGNSRIAARILVAGAAVPMDGLRPWRARRAEGPVADAVLADRPDLLVLEAGLADAALAELLAGPEFSGMPLILLVESGDAEAAGLLLERPVLLLESGAGAAALEAAATEALAGHGHGAAEMRAIDTDARLAALRRDADRVAAALAELSGRSSEPERPVTSGRIRAHIKARRQRERFFAAELFADPVWDILLDLSAARAEGRPVSISSLCIAAAVPTTTGLRTIKAMVERGLLERRVDPADARRSFVEMTGPCHRAMDGCLEAVLNLPGQ
jgi:DNA-binding MarR family transcriptional regulator